VTGTWTIESGAISVFAQSQDGARVSPKTRAGRRTVDVGPAVLRLLREQQLARAPNEEGLLFPGESGAPFDASNFMRRRFKPAAAVAGFPSSPSTTSGTRAPRS
jgi:integrase